MIIGALNRFVNLSISGVVAGANRMMCFYRKA